MKQTVLLTTIWLALPTFVSCDRSEDAVKTRTSEPASTSANVADGLSADGAENNDPEQVKTQIEAEITAMEQRKLEEQQELELLTFINQGLCQKLVEQRYACPATMPLLVSATERPTQCGAIIAEQLKEPTIEALVSSNPEAEFQLIANGSFKSSKFSGASYTKITFTQNNPNSSIPRLIDLTSLQLINLTDDAPVLGFLMRIDGNDLIQFDDFTQKSDGSYQLSADAMRNLRTDENCQDNQQTVDQMVEELKTEYQEQQDTQIPQQAALQP